MSRYRDIILLQGGGDAVKTADWVMALIGIWTNVVATIALILEIKKYRANKKTATQGRQAKA